MGRLAQNLAKVGATIPRPTVNIGRQIPTWEDGSPQYPRYWHNYFRFSLEGYGRNEIVFACVEELSSSAAEPRLACVVKTPHGPEQLKDAPILDLFEHPNPYMSRYELIASLVMYRAIAGNAYLYKARSASGKVVELWPLRPDRVYVIPDKQKYIGGWEYRLESETFRVAKEDVIQFRTRNPLDDWYGLPPLAVCAERVDTDAMMRSFTLAFFRNAAVPAGLLTVTKQVTAAERQLIRDRFRSELGGPQNWHQMMVMDGMEAKYTTLGMGLGQDGIILPGLDEISEARIAMAFGVPLELIGSRLTSSRGGLGGKGSATKEARADFWDQTLGPLYQDMATCLTRGMAGEASYDTYDYLEFDTSTVKSLSEDVDALHTRVRADVQAGLISLQEGRRMLGMEEDFVPDDLVYLNEQWVASTAADVIAPPPTPAPIPATPPPPALSNGNSHAPVDMDALRALAAGKEDA